MTDEELKEEWRPVLGYEGIYEASNCGNIRVTATQKVKRTHPNNRGYLTVSLYKDGKGATRLAHRIVIAAFRGSSALTVDHVNSDRKDNRLENLCYVTQRENLTRKYDGKRTLPIGVQQNKGNKSFHAKIWHDGNPLAKPPRPTPSIRAGEKRMSRYQTAISSLDKLVSIDFDFTDGEIADWSRQNYAAIREALALSAALEEVPEGNMVNLSGPWSDGFYNCRIEDGGKFKFKVPEGEGKTPLEALQSALSKMKGEK